jgi:hypothetical protein
MSAQQTLTQMIKKTNQEQLPKKEDKYNGRNMTLLTNLLNKPKAQRQEQGRDQNVCINVDEPSVKIEESSVESVKAENIY